MRLYHASTLVIKKPDVLHSRENLDFGCGFYLTAFREQAVRYAERFTRRGKEGLSAKLVLSLEHVKLPESTTYVDGSAFNDCTLLRENH